MKSCTSLKQSKKLSEILSFQTADMYYINSNTITIGKWEDDTHDEDDLPCWSLSALLDILKIFTTPTAFSVKVCVPLLRKTNNGYILTYAGDYALMHNNTVDITAPIEIVEDDPIDACYEMILKLHELNLI